MPRFTLLGGPLFHLGRRLRLVRDGNTVRLGVAIGVCLWLVAVALAVAQGLGGQLFSRSVLAAHVRLLLVIPLFFFTESLLDPRMASFVNGIARTGIVPDDERSALEATIARTTRLKDSWIAEATCLALAVLMSVGGTGFHLVGATASLDPSRAEGGLAWAGRWYWAVCLPCFRFLVFRWLWRLGLWSYFLWSISRLKLNLLPTHPDGVAGLGALEVVHTHFVPLVLALSTLQAASLAEELSRGTAGFDAVYPAFAVVLLVDAVLFVAPLCIFSPQLMACRVAGLREYGEFAGQYVRGFDDKWLHRTSPDVEHLLGTPDLQSLADLSNSIAIVRSMRLAPVSASLLAVLGTMALLPALPLLLFKYPLTELTRRLLTMVVGL